MDPKTRFLQDLLKRSSDEHGAALKSKYAPKPPPAPLPEEPAEPADPLDGVDLADLEQLVGAEPKSASVSMDAKHVLTTEGYDPTRKDQFGRPMPKDERGNQYTEEGLRRLRASDPEWPDQLREIRRLSKEEEG